MHSRRLLEGMLPRKHLSHDMFLIRSRYLRNMIIFTPRVGFWKRLDVVADSNRPGQGRKQGWSVIYILCCESLALFVVQSAFVFAPWLFSSRFNINTQRAGPLIQTCMRQRLQASSASSPPPSTGRYSVVFLLPLKPFAYASTRRHPSAFPMKSALPARRTSGLDRSTCPGRLSINAARQEIL